MIVTPLYAGLLGLLLLALSINVIRDRFRTKVSLGDGNDALLQKSIRAHGNFVEYAPLGLVLIAVAELQGAPAFAVHLLGTALRVATVICFGLSDF